MPTEKTEGRVVYVCPVEGCKMEAFAPQACVGGVFSDNPVHAMVSMVALPLYSLEEVAEKLLTDYDEDGSPVDLAAEHIAHGIPGSHSGWRGRTRGALEKALAAAFQDHNQERDDDA